MAIFIRARAPTENYPSAEREDRRKRKTFLYNSVGVGKEYSLADSLKM
jgi:hypothetical protein